MVGCWAVISFCIHMHFVCKVVTVNAADKYTWVSLTDSELKQWYSPTDLCALENTDIKEFPQFIRANNCSKYSHGSKRLHCGVGMGSNNHACYAPFGAARPSYKRGVQGYTNFDSKPLLEFLTQLYETNTTLVIIGDSTSRQKLQALECELLREDKRVKVRGHLWGTLPCNTTLKVYLPPDKQRLTVIQSISMGPNSATCLKGGKGASAPASGAFENAQFIVDQLTASNRSVFIVANIGLWYNDLDLFNEVVPPVLQWLLEVARQPHRSNVVTWHETFSQHWINPTGSGYFSKGYADLQERQPAFKLPHLVDAFDYQVPTCCRHVTNTSYLADWRNDVIHTHLHKMDRNGLISVLPMAAITRPVADMHTCNPLYSHDCTHYCFWPLMWQPFWHQLQQKMHEKYPVSKK